MKTTTNGYGIGMPYRKVFTSDGKDVSELVIKFKYKYSEKKADECTLVLKSADKTLPDKPLLQDNCRLTVTWGYINGASKTRKVYIFDSDPKLDDNGVELTLTCHDKFSGVGDVTDNHVHTNATLEDVAKRTGALYGLKVEFLKNEYEADNALTNDVNNPYGSPVLPGPSSAGFNKFLATRGYERENITVNNKDGTVITKKIVVPLNMENILTKYGYLPQANKSHKQLLHELAHKEPGGPYIVTGRDDGLIIRKRNFNQKPFRTYSFAKEDGNLLEFNPEIKNKHKHKGSAKTTVVSFDRYNKQAVSDDRTVLNDNKSTNKLGSTTDMPKEIGGKIVIAPSDPGFKRFRDASGNVDIAAVIKASQNNSGVIVQKRTLNNVGATTSKTNPFSGGVSYTMARDNIATVKNIGDIFSPQTMIIGTPENLKNAQAQGSNDRLGQELQRNPGKAKVLGNPLIEDNIILTFIVWSQKFSGNYYIEECEHDIDESGAYHTSLSILRTGTNSITGKPANKQDVKSVNKVNNNKKGPVPSTSAFKNWQDFTNKNKVKANGPADKLKGKYILSQNINAQGQVISTIVKNSDGTTSTIK